MKEKDFKSLSVDEQKEKINELIIFFAIIAGLATFGFWGMIIGPAITVLFLTLMKITEAQTDESAR